MNFNRDDDAARQLIKDADNIEQILQKEFASQIEVFCAARKRTDLEIALEGARIAQGNKSRGGWLYEEAVRQAMKRISQLKINIGWKIPGYKHKPLDAFIDSPSKMFFITMKRSLRERLDNWNQQGPHCSRYATQIGRDYRFFAFTHDIRIETARGKIEKNITVISTRNHDQIRQALSEIGDATKFSLVAE